MEIVLIKRKKELVQVLLMLMLLLEKECILNSLLTWLIFLQHKETRPFQGLNSWCSINWFLGYSICFLILVYCFRFWIDCVIVVYYSVCILLIDYDMESLTFVEYFRITLLIYSIKNFHSTLLILSTFTKFFWKFNSPPSWTRPKLCFYAWMIIWSFSLTTREW